MTDKSSNAIDLYTLAQKAYRNRDFEHCLQLATSALDIVRESKIDDELHIKIIRLLLSCGSIEWRGQSELPGQVAVAGLFAEAESIAEAHNHKALLAQIKNMHGNYLLYTSSVDASIHALREAHTIAQDSGDRLTEYLTIASLGHQMVKVDLEQGLALIYEAQTIYERDADQFASLQSLSPEILTSQLYVRSSQGVGEFDRGNYGLAMQILEASVADHKAYHLDYNLPSVLNYLAQVNIAIGNFEAAEANLKEAIALFADAKIPHPWNGNNWALLGKLYIEWQRLDEAEQPLSIGLKISEDRYNIDLISLVRNYFGEYLIHPDCKERNFALAETYLMRNLEECKSSGIHRSVIQALTLLGQLYLMQGDIEKSYAYSLEAVEYLDRMKNMPALRMEEIYYNHYVVLKNVNKIDDAQDYLEKAYNTIIELKDTIIEDQYKDSFWTRVPLNVEIVRAYTS